jgi:hypothetical protein
MNSSYQRSLLAAATLASLALASCGGQTDYDGDSSRPVSGLSARLDLNASSGAAAASLKLDARSTGVYSLNATGLNGAKYLYGSVSYDPTTMHFSGSMTPDAAPADGLMLALDKPSEGRVDFGWVQTNFDQKSGVSGDLAIAQLSFAPGAASALRTVSGPPEGNEHAVVLTGSVDGANIPTLRWVEKLNGDGNNDGQVTVQDLTPIGLFFNQNTTDDGSPARDADYNKDGKVSVQDLTSIGLNFRDDLGGYAIFRGPDGANLSEVDRVNRADEFPAPVPQGELQWEVSSTVLAADTVFRVQPFDKTGALGTPSNAVTLDFTVTEPPIVAIDSIEFDKMVAQTDPENPNEKIYVVDGSSATWLQQSGDYAVIISELSVDATDGNAEDIDILAELLQLRAMVIVQGDSTPQDGTDKVQWVITDGGGLADVSNTGTAKGEMRFHDRGRVEVTAHVSGDFNNAQSITFRIFTIDSLALEVAGGGTGPVNVNSGDDVDFVATGTFDWDSIDNGDELDRNLTGFCNWGVLQGGANTGSFSVDTATGTLLTGSAASGDVASIFAEFPGTPTVTLFDNLARSSGLIDVNIN